MDLARFPNIESTRVATGDNGTLRLLVRQPCLLPLDKETGGVSLLDDIMFKEEKRREHPLLLAVEPPAACFKRAGKTQAIKCMHEKAISNDSVAHRKWIN